MAVYRGEQIDLKPTDAMRNNARQALEWREEFNRGGTDVGVARARTIINGQELSPRTIRRMVSFFARHEVDQEAEGFRNGEEGFPSAGRIAWDLWGGDAGRTWANRKDKQLDRIDESKGFDMTKKVLVQTSETNGHVHTYDNEMQGGMTSPPLGQSDGHVHRFVRDDEGNIVIFEAEGHTHEPAPMDRRQRDDDEDYDKQQDFEVGDFVRWEASGGTARGRITRIIRDGEVDVPDSSFTITGTPGDPAALIRVYRPIEDEFEPTDRIVGHKFSALTLIPSLENRSYPMKEKKYLNVPFEVKEVKQQGDLGIIRGYASTFGNVDRGFDVIERGAFTRTLAEHKQQSRPIRMLWQHDGNELIGGYPADKAFEDERGLFVEGNINLETQKGREAYALAKQGVLSDFSIGFIIRQSEIDDNEEDKNTVRRIRDVDLFEISLVGEPMNTQAIMTEIKAVVPFQNLPLANRERDWDSNAAIGRVREFVGATERPNREYRRAFLFYDRENQGNFGAYKLPIADVIDGQLKAVPRAIFAAAGVLSGARGGVDLSVEDRAGIIRNVNRYYEEMGLPSPLEESRSFRVDDAKAYSERELEELLKSGVRFSRSMAKTIVSVLLGDGRRDAALSSQRDAELKAKLIQLNQKLSNLLQ